MNTFPDDIFQIFLEYNEQTEIIHILNKIKEIENKKVITKYNKTSK